jgi:hypothetical protein
LKGSARRCVVSLLFKIDAEGLTQTWVVLMEFANEQIAVARRLREGEKAVRVEREDLHGRIHLGGLLLKERFELVTDVNVIAELVHHIGGVGFEACVREINLVKNSDDERSLGGISGLGREVLGLRLEVAKGLRMLVLQHIEVFARDRRGDDVASLVIDGGVENDELRGGVEGVGIRGIRGLLRECDGRAGGDCRHGSEAQETDRHHWVTLPWIGGGEIDVHGYNSSHANQS